MGILRAVVVAFSTFSRIPMPRFDWTQADMRPLFMVFPLVGIAVGFIQFLWSVLCFSIGVPAALFAVGALVIPIIVTGGIHMDGFCDTVDALASHQPQERALEIMHDSATGSFANMYASISLVITFATFYEAFNLGYTVVLALLPLYILSRAITGILAYSLPHARSSIMLERMAQKTEEESKSAFKKSTIFLGILWSILALLLAGLSEIVISIGMIVTAIVWAFIYRNRALVRFGGITGDTSGFYIQSLETVAPFVSLMIFYSARSFGLC